MCTYTIHWSGNSGKRTGTITYDGPAEVAWDSFDTCVDPTAATGTLAANRAASCMQFYDLSVRVLRRTDNNEIIGVGNCCNTDNVITSSSDTCRNEATTIASEQATK